MKKTPRPRGKTDSGDSLISKLKEQIRQLKSTVRRLQKQISKLKDEILVTESQSDSLLWELEAQIEEPIPKSSDVCRKCKATPPDLVKMILPTFIITSCTNCGDRYRKPRKEESNE